ncbi:MAG: hypothetical protein ACYDAR_08150 [Thermomicrobiales bacterium]
MRVRQAKDVARRWVIEEASTALGFAGAFYHGSTNWLSDDATLPTTSDLDVMVALDTPNPPAGPGKFRYRGVLLEVSYLPSDQVSSAERVLGRYDLAGSFRNPGIILDPSGRLTALQATVSKAYAKRQWVSRRCEDARERVLRNLQSLDAAAPFHDQVTAWLFATGVTTHVPLVAGLKNPTVRTRYLAVRELLAEYGYSSFYPTLLALLGCARMNRAQIKRHLDALTEAFDAAKAVVKTPFFFAADLSDQARPVAIDGSRELIARGDHREAIFWMVATYSRCEKVLYHDAPPAMRGQFTPGYRRLLGDLGITAFADLQGRGEQVKECLPQLWTVAEAIMAANQGIEG